MKQLAVREFLRGGYQTITEPTVVSSRGYILFTVFPGPPRKKASPTAQQSGTVRTGSTGPSPNGG